MTGAAIRDFFETRRAVGGITVTGNPDDGYRIAWIIGGPYFTTDAAVLAAGLHARELRRALDEDGILPDDSLSDMTASLYDYDGDDE